MSSFISSSGLTYLWTKIKAWVNGQGFLTQHQDISGKADKATSLEGYGITDVTILNNNAIKAEDSNSTACAIITLSSTNNLHIGSGSATAGYNTFINGNTIYLRYGTGHEVGLTLSNTGYVTINNSLSVGDSVTADSFTGDLAGNASTSTKLASSVTLWGQSFDGSADVSGAMTGVGNITTSGHIYLDNNKIIYSKDSNGTNRGLIYFSSNNSVNVGSGTIAASGDTLIYGTNIIFRIGGTGTANTALTIDSSKNININGNTSIAGTLTLGGNPVAVVYSGSTAPSSSTGSNGDIYIQTS